MTDALIGYTGFVGSTLLRARSFDACLRSTDIDAIRGRAFDTIYCCGAPAEKWRANKDPAEDRARLATLTNALGEVEARRFVLISTIIHPDVGQPYGLHRLQLEEFCRSRFDTTVIRLPGLYGRGLKKNAIFDLLNGRSVDAIPGNACFQFYDISRIHSDIERILGDGIETTNITAEPVAMTDVARQVFGRSMPTPFSAEAPSYDVRSIRASLVGGHKGYWFTSSQVIDGLQAFVASEQAR
jgi:nucleoside-diphosphate-sugar epimerase